MPPYILAVDIGTTSTKSMAIAVDGRVLASHSVGYPTYFPKPGHFEQDPKEVLKAVKNCVQQTHKDCQTNQLLALSFSAAMHSLMAVDSNGHALTPLVIWSDMRSADQANDLITRGVAFKIYEATGTAIHPMSPLCKLMWWRRHQPDLIKNAFKFLSIKDYILHYLTGQWITDHSIASATGMFNIRSLTWNAESIKEAGIQIHQLPTPVSTTEIISGISEKAKEELQIPSNIKIIPGASDGCLANLGANAIHAGELCLTIGTSGAVRMIVADSKTDTQQRTFNYILSKNRMVVGGATNNGAVLLQWFENSFGKEGDHSIYEDVEKACDENIASSSLIFLPYVLGERAPVYDPLARGVFFGLAMHHDRSHLLRALVEGICFSLLSIAKSLEDVTDNYKVVVASGGFIRSPKWVQLLSDVFGKPVKVIAQNDASTIGAARLGFEALQMEDRFFENHEEEVVYYPDLKKHEFYQKKFEIFLSLYRNLKQDFYNLSKLGDA